MRRLAVLAVAPALAAGALLAHGLARAQPPAEPLLVSILAPHGGQTSERVVTVRGRVAGYRGDRMTLVVNGIPMSVGVANGSFEQPQVLGPGLNSIRAVASQDGATAEDQVALYAQVPSKDLRVTLTWDTGGTDVDLWVTGPDGEKIMYNHRQGAAGGTLDTDVTTGFGPETYTHVARDVPHPGARVRHRPPHARRGDDGPLRGDARRGAPRVPRRPAQDGGRGGGRGVHVEVDVTVFCATT
jgi:hypothetical protein